MDGVPTTSAIAMGGPGAGTNLENMVAMLLDDWRAKQANMTLLLGALTTW